MHRRLFVAAGLSFLLLSFAHAQGQQTPLSTETEAVVPATNATSPIADMGQIRKSHTVCFVRDIQGSRVWLSPVVEYEYAGDQNVAWRRKKSMAAEFHALVVAAGGAGDKTCVGWDARQDVVAYRALLLPTTAAQRSDGANATIYTELEWSPKPWHSSMAVVESEVSQFVRCEVPDLRAQSSIVSPIFETLMPPPYDERHQSQLEQIKQEFRQTVVLPRRMRDEFAKCSASDTYAEAKKTADDYREIYTVVTPRYQEIAWTPATRRVPTSIPAVADVASTANSAAPAPRDAVQAEVPVASIVSYVPNVAILKSPGAPAVVPILFGVCASAGHADRTVKIHVSPVFEVRNDGNEQTAVLAQRFSAEYGKASAQVRKLKHSNPVCEIAATRLDVAVRRINLMAAFGTLIANTPGGEAALVTRVDWLPAGASESPAPSGERVPLYIVCTASGNNPPSVWYARPFLVPGTDAAAQLEFVKTMHAGYAKFIEESLPRGLGLYAVSCNASESAANLEYVSASQATLLARGGYKNFLVNWPTSPSAATTTADTKGL